VKPAGSFYVFVDISDLAKSCEEFAIDLLKTEGVVVVPGTAFGPSGEGFVRLSFATDESRIAEGIKRLSHYASA
jgi:aspartate/methionine/tyrosine aminotransferase